MTLLQAIWLAILQGVTELFPISSLGHSVLVPSILHSNINLLDPNFVPFLTLLHLGTAAALLIFFWRDWVTLIQAFFTSFSKFGGKGRLNEHERLIWLLIVATIPAGLVGLVLHKKLEALFGAPTIVAVALILNGFVLLVGDRMRGRAGTTSLEKLSLGTAFGIGLSQILALIPGFSRSGATLVGSLMAGLGYEEAARFSFLMATPVIAAAGVLEVPKLLKHGGTHGMLTSSVVGAIVAFIAAYLSIGFLMKYFKQAEVKALRPFAYYCIAAGIVSVVLLKVFA